MRSTKQNLHFTNIISGFFTACAAIFFLSCVENYIDDNSLEIYPHYFGSDLGLQYSMESSTFKVWSPVASSITLKIYAAGSRGEVLQVHDMEKGNAGEWQLTLEGDLEGKFYTYQATINNKLKREIVDPYAYAVGINGNRAAIIDLEKTNPDEWRSDRRPLLKSFNDLVIYETHVRDFSIDAASGIKNKGKYLAFTEKNTKGPDSVSTGLDHLVDLGITHLHILPVFDFASINEEDPAAYNWGYDPKNYNTSEGSYATNPFNPYLRVKEFKQMVQALHSSGIGVIMDVVYNHSHDTEIVSFNHLMPDYYYRQKPSGTYSNASGCGNELATERSMVSKFIVESVIHWAREYHIDGFRFDLMGAIDIETMVKVRKALDEIDPNIFIYGEGWTVEKAAYPDNKLATKSNVKWISRVGAFNDDMRDGVINFVAKELEGEQAFRSLESVKFGIAAATSHPGIDYEGVNYSKKPWAKEPFQSINYVSCHDDLTLWDQILYLNPSLEEDEHIKMHLLSNTIILTSQGVPFLQAGVDFLGTKHGNENSFNAADSVNKLDWKRKADYQHVHEYYQKLIKLRKAHPAFRLSSQREISNNLTFFDIDYPNIIAYSLDGSSSKDEWKQTILAFNGNHHEVEISLPGGEWTVALNSVEKYVREDGGNKISDKLTVPGKGAIILFKRETSF